jgi:hypothetical protein
MQGTHGKNAATHSKRKGCPLTSPDWNVAATERKSTIPYRATALFYMHKALKK